MCTPGGHCLHDEIQNIAHIIVRLTSFPITLWAALCRRLHSVVLEETNYSRDAKDRTLGGVALQDAVIGYEV